MDIDEINVKLTGEEAQRDEKLTSKGSFDWEAFVKKNKTSVIFGLLGIFLLGIGVLATVIWSSKENETGIEIISASSASPSLIYIHITGAVEKPGLYQLPADSRVNDALVASGGLSAQADRSWFDKNINLAQKLSDGVKIIIPFKNEVSAESNVANTAKGTVVGAQTSIFTDQQGKINLNTASITELDTLSGIGPAYAQRIIDFRNSNGPFAKIEDIMKVPGIGQKTFDKIKDKITVF